MGHTCGEPNEIELTAAHRSFYRPPFFSQAKAIWMVSDKLTYRECFLPYIEAEGWFRFCYRGGQTAPHRPNRPTKHHCKVIVVPCPRPHVKRRAVNDKVGGNH